MYLTTRTTVFSLITWWSHWLTGCYFSNSNIFPSLFCGRIFLHMVNTFPLAVVYYYSDLFLELTNFMRQFFICCMQVVVSSLSWWKLWSRTLVCQKWSVTLCNTWFCHPDQIARFGWVNSDSVVMKEWVMTYRISFLEEGKSCGMT